MLRKTRDFSELQCILWMYTFNPGKVNIYPNRKNPRYLISAFPITELKFPDGWYYCSKTSTINNKYSATKIRIFTTK